MNSFRLFTLTLAFGLVGTTIVSADPLITYDFENPSNILAPNAASHADGLSVETLSLHNLAHSSHNYNGDRAVTLKPDVAQSSYSVANTLADATYLSIKLTVEKDRTLSLDSLSFQAAAGGPASHRAFYVLSSLTGFATIEDVLLSSRMNHHGSGGTLPPRDEGLKDYSVPLADRPAFRNIPAGTEVEFRIYIQTDSPDRSVDFGNLTLTGTLAPAAP